MRADLDELVHARQAAEDHPITQMHVAAERRVVGENRAVGDLAIMRNVHVGHDPVVVADTRHANVLRGAEVEGAELADRVALADLEPRRLAGVFLVLRHRAERAELEDAVVAADRRVAFDDAVRADARALVDAHVRTNDGVGVDADRFAELRAGFDDRGGVDRRHAELSRRGASCTSIAPTPRARRRPTHAHRT